MIRTAVLYCLLRYVLSHATRMAHRHPRSRASPYVIVLRQSRLQAVALSQDDAAWLIAYAYIISYNFGKR